MALTGFMDFASTLFGEVLQLDEQAVDDVRKALETSAEDVRSSEVDRLSESWFGGGSMGSRMASNTSMAHAAVREEMESLVEALLAYRQNIELFAADVRDADEQADANLRIIEQTAACIDTSAASGDQQCAPPTATGGRG